MSIIEKSIFSPVKSVSDVSFFDSLIGQILVNTDDATLE